MTVWMLYSALVALIVAAAARAAEWLARLAGYRVRWVWAGALALTTFLSASALLREARPTALPATVSPTMAPTRPGDVQAGASWRRALSVRIESVRVWLNAPLRSAATNVRRAVPPAADVIAASLASMMSVAFVLVLVGVGRRFGSARHEWPVVRLQGVDVRVAPRIGPVVVGFARPEIVVPRWLLARPADEQRLVVTHEAEHIRARDPLLLGAALGAVAVAPWSPAVWYMVSRLRLAVELDCDARVLRRGATPASYGSLLIDVAEHASALRASALALADDSSHLRQRILAMRPNVPRFARVRAALAAAFALAGVLVACQSTLPTDAEVEQMDVATATRAARELASARHADTTVAYTIDGVKATASEAAALAPVAVGRVQVVTGAAGKPTRIDVETRKPAPKATGGDSGRVQRAALMRDGTAGQVDTVRAPGPFAAHERASFTGLIFIDGVRVSEMKMRSLDPDQIASIEVIKGAAAAQHYSDRRAAAGVIEIRTKP